MSSNFTLDLMKKKTQVGGSFHSILYFLLLELLKLIGLDIVRTKFFTDHHKSQRINFGFYFNL